MISMVDKLQVFCRLKLFEYQKFTRFVVNFFSHHVPRDKSRIRKVETFYFFLLLCYALIGFVLKLILTYINGFFDPTTE